MSTARTNLYILPSFFISFFFFFQEKKTKDEKEEEEEDEWVPLAAITPRPKLVSPPPPPKGERLGLRKIFLHQEGGEEMRLLSFFFVGSPQDLYPSLFLGKPLFIVVQQTSAIEKALTNLTVSYNQSLPWYKKTSCATVNFLPLTSNCIIVRTWEFYCTSKVYILEKISGKVSLSLSLSPSFDPRKLPSHGCSNLSLVIAMSASSSSFSSKVICG